MKSFFVSRLLSAALATSLLAGCQHPGLIQATPQRMTAAAPDSGFQIQAARASRPPRPDFSRLSLLVELHVENALLPTDQETDYVIQLAQAARAAGVTLSIGLGVDFLRSYNAGATVHAPLNGDFTLSSLVALLQTTYGHTVNLHADVPESASYAEIIHYLPPYVRELNDAGAQGSVASGACNEAGADGGWVKGALDSGVTTIAGVVEDCQASLSATDYPTLWLDPAIVTPSRFHHPAPYENPRQRAQGWFTNNVSTWISPYTPDSTETLNTSLFIVGSMGEAHPACLAETAAGTSCSDQASAEQGTADANALLADLVQVVDLDRSGTSGDAYHAAFSTNIIVSATWINAYFSTLAAGIRNGSTPAGTTLASAVQYSTLGAVAEANRQELRASLP
ncbi:MAG: hypothetical protein ACAI44_30220 [Candidatus Sericytochromatia bacterium]